MSALARSGVALFLFVLGACNAPSTVNEIGYRNAELPIGSKAILDEARFQGRWFVVGRIGDVACRTLAVTYALDGAPTLKRECAAGARSETAGRRLATARFEFDQQQHWVVWLDEAYRTAVIGAPNGAFAWILNRTEQISADRMVAAREILDFSGYDLSQITGDSR